MLSIIIIIIIGIRPLGWFGQRRELSQATGMALVCCTLGKFLGVVCHCFPLLWAKYMSDWADIQARLLFSEKYLVLNLCILQYLNKTLSINKY